MQVGVGDSVSVCPEDESEAVYIAQIIALWEDNSSTHRKQFHAKWFSRSSDTVLGEVSGGGGDFIPPHACTCTT